jgi:hypothetical protein
MLDSTATCGCDGVVQNGVVVLDEPAALPDGTRVRVNKIERPITAQSTLKDRLLKLAKEAESLPCDLPEDLAENHNLYLYGMPNRVRGD